ncbi:MAG: hypothetical protein HY774_29440 [Acidobacteria bacterium]|nr:hypothetical protein [Acidobacteriota bacterium]
MMTWLGSTSHVPERKFSRRNIPPKFDIKQIQELKKEWATFRKNYPGWVVCPKDEREELWQDTDCFFSDILHFLKEQNTTEFSGIPGEQAR